MASSKEMAHSESAPDFMHLGRLTQPETLSTDDGGPVATSDSEALPPALQVPPRKTRVPTPLPRVATLANTRVLAGSASNQSLFTVRSVAPSFGFGSASREAAGKVTGQTERLLGAASPGPVHILRPTVGGKHPAQRSPPMWGFSKADRFLYGYGKPEKRPGPESYNASRFALGAHQPDGRKANAPRFSMTGRARPPVDAGLSSPGPAAYLLPNSVGGKQPDARNADPPTWTMKGRDMIHKGCEPEPGREAPGPIYNVPRGIGKQPDDRVRSEPAYTIAGRSRTPVEPGLQSPGAIYNLPSAIERQVDGHKKSAPRPSFSRHSRWAQYEAELKRNSVPGPGAYG
jgi:hypothetical protein